MTVNSNTLEDHSSEPGFEHAVSIAIKQIPIQERCVIESARTDYIIVLRSDSHGNPHYMVYNESAWTSQSESMLPWSEPIGDKIARVDHRTGEVKAV